jgi:hypothetical protein
VLSGGRAHTCWQCALICKHTTVAGARSNPQKGGDFKHVSEEVTALH